MIRITSASETACYYRYIHNGMRHMRYFIVSNIEETIQDLKDAGWIFCTEPREKSIEIFFNDAVDEDDMKSFNIQCL